MKDDDTYKRCIAALYEKTNGRFEHAEDKAIDLFDKLIDKGIHSHCDTVKKLCLEVGYHQCAAQEIATIYDTVSIYKQHKASRMSYWDIDRLLTQ